MQMSLWFLFAVISFIFGGFQVFSHKIGAQLHYNSNILNSVSAAISALIGIIAVSFLEGFGELSWALAGLGFFGGVVFLIGSNIRMDALRYIDTTIFLPLHKFISPIAALVLGIFFFQETLTQSEWIGIILGITIPLLLISRSEKHRQKNLTRGLALMVIAALIGSIVAAINKLGANLFTSVLLFATSTHIFASIFGIILNRVRKPNVQESSKNYFSKEFIGLSIFAGVSQAIGFGTFMLAFAYGGELAIVYTINSLYILIPIVLSIIFFKEHWNLRKAAAIGLSIVSLFFLR